MRRVDVVLLILFSLGMVFAPLMAQPGVSKNVFLVWASGGRSSIINNVSGRKCVGGGGAAMGAGYEIRMRDIFLQTGVEFSYYTSKMNLLDTSLVVQMTDTEGDLFDAHFAFHNTADFQRITNVGVPLMLGYELPSGLFFAIGGKAVFNITGSSRVRTDVTSTSYYGNLIGDNNDGVLSDMPNHGMSNELRVVRGAFSLRPILSGTIEVGYTFGKNQGDFAAKNKPKVRLSLFCDYGLSSVADKDKTNELFVNASKTGLFIPAIQGYLFNGAKLNKLNMLYTGLKVTVLLGSKKYKCNCL